MNVPKIFTKDNNIMIIAGAIPLYSAVFMMSYLVGNYNYFQMSLIGLPMTYFLIQWYYPKKIPGKNMIYELFGGVKN